MHKVLEHIDRHLDQPLPLERLARVANFSSFHFHRLFSAWMDETLGEYLRRRRLELAALRLVAQPELPVLHVALSVGFGSTEAFARAFKARFGWTPTSWRLSEREKRAASAERRPASRSRAFRSSNRYQSKSKPNQGHMSRMVNHEASVHRPPEASMRVKFVDRQPTTVAYLRHIGPYGQPLAEFWRRTVYPWLETNDLLAQPRYGISHDDPGITAPEKCRYDAGVEVPPDFVGAGRHLTMIIPGGTYAAVKFKGRVSEIGEAWAALLRDWLPTSGMQLDSRPFFEYYPRGATYNPKTGVFDCDLYVPLVAL